MAFLERHIGRLGFVIPVLQNKNSLGFVTAIGMGDTKKNIEGNFGLGYRNIVNNHFIFGWYAFYDLRSSKYNNKLHQATIGFEFMTNNVEFRMNGYMPFNQHTLENFNVYNIKYKETINYTLYKKTHHKIIEKGLAGFDVEGGGSLPIYNPASGYLAFYYFAADGIQSVTGVRLRANYKLARWLSFDWESNKDKVRGLTSYLGINLSWDFDNSLTKKKYSLNRLEIKMTQLPVRDIDIVEGIKKSQKVVAKKDTPGISHLVAPGFIRGVDKMENESPEHILVGKSTNDVTKLREDLVNGNLSNTAFVGDNIIFDDNVTGETKLASDPSLPLSTALDVAEATKKGAISRSSAESKKTRTNVTSIIAKNDPPKLPSLLHDEVISLQEAYQSPDIPDANIRVTVQDNRRQELRTAGLATTGTEAQDYIHNGTSSVAGVRNAITAASKARRQQELLNAGFATNSQAAQNFINNGNDTVASEAELVNAGIFPTDGRTYRGYQVVYLTAEEAQEMLIYQQLFMTPTGSRMIDTPHHDFVLRALNDRTQMPTATDYERFMRDYEGLRDHSPQRYFNNISTWERDGFNTENHPIEVYTKYLNGELYYGVYNGAHRAAYAIASNKGLKIFIKPNTAWKHLWYRQPMSQPLTSLHPFDFNKIAARGYTDRTVWH